MGSKLWGGPSMQITRQCRSPTSVCGGWDWPPWSCWSWVELVVELWRGLWAITLLLGWCSGACCRSSRRFTASSARTMRWRWTFGPKWYGSSDGLPLCFAWWRGTWLVSGLLGCMQLMRLFGGVVLWRPKSPWPRSKSLAGGMTDGALMLEKKIRFAVPRWWTGRSALILSLCSLEHLVI